MNLCDVALLCLVMHYCCWHLAVLQDQVARTNYVRLCLKLRPSTKVLCSKSLMMLYLWCTNVLLDCVNTMPVAACVVRLCLCCEVDVYLHRLHPWCWCISTQTALHVMHQSFSGETEKKTLRPNCGSLIFQVELRFVILIEIQEKRKRKNVPKFQLKPNARPID